MQTILKKLLNKFNSIIRLFYFVLIFSCMDVFGQQSTDFDSTFLQDFTSKNTNNSRWSVFAEISTVYGILKSHVPIRHDYAEIGLGCYCSTEFTYENIISTPTNGFNLGFNYMIKKIGDFSIISGLSYLHFKYDGKASEYQEEYYFMNGETSRRFTGIYSFYYTSNFLNIPFILKYNFLKEEKSSVFINSGSSASLIISQHYSGIYGSDQTDKDFFNGSPFKQNFAVFLLAGAGFSFDILTGHLMSFSIEYKKEILLPVKAKADYQSVGGRFEFSF